MYNPYNWDIKNQYGLNKNDLIKEELESDLEYKTRLLNELSLACTVKNVIKTSINLAQMNLTDSLKTLTNLDNNIDTCNHDITVLEREIQNYQYICNYIKDIEKHFRD